MEGGGRNRGKLLHKNFTLFKLRIIIITITNLILILIMMSLLPMALVKADVETG